MKNRIRSTLAFVLSAGLLALGSTGAAAAEKKHAAWLGVSVKDVDEDTAKAFALKDSAGAIVTEVSKGSPARKAGVHRGDLLLEMDGKMIADAEDLAERVRAQESGSKVKLKLLRGGERQTVEATLEEREKSSHSEWDFNADDFIESHPKMHSFTLRVPEMWKGVTRGRLGVRAYDLNDDLSEYFKVKQGALVLDVDEESPAERAGIKAGDVITEVSGTKVADRDELVAALEKHEDDKSVTVKLQRHGKPMELKVDLSGKKRHHASPVDEA